MNNVELMSKLAVEWAKEAGKLCMERRKYPVEVLYKTSPSDLVTLVDKEVEEFISRKIIEHFPDHGIVGEEGTREHDPSQFDTLWIIDPIDGTTNFVHQQLNYVVSIAVVHKGAGLFGVIYDPTRDELFYGEKSKGAYLNHLPLLLDKPVALREALVCTSLFWNGKAEKYGLEHLVHELPKRCRGIRVYGCAALEMAYVAAGRVDAYVSLGLHPWDFAAGKIILEEAAGVVSTIEGNELSFEKRSTVIASNPKLHSELLALLKGGPPPNN